MRQPSTKSGFAGLALTVVTLLSAACGSAPAGLSPAARHFEATQKAFDQAHPGLVNCEATVEVLVAESAIDLQHGGQAITPDAALQKYPGTVATQVYPYFYNALNAYIASHGAQGSGATTAVIGGPGDTLLQHRCLTALSIIHHQAPAPTSTPSYPTPTPEASGPAGCPGSATLVAAWNAAPASTFQAQSIARIPISGFNDISCWNGWVVASVIANANGLAVFSENGGLHMLSGTEMRQFKNAVCSTPGSPAAWNNPAQRPVTCG